jgi:hypothetical protein
MENFIVEYIYSNNMPINIDKNILYIFFACKRRLLKQNNKKNVHFNFQRFPYNLNILRISILQNTGNKKFTSFVR